MANGTVAISQIEMLTQSGTGIISIVPPATNTNRTLTLPDSTGTVQTVAGVLTQFNASGSAPVYACRAWVNFNGSGTVAIRGNGNVSSITDVGVGEYTVNFTTAMQDANYTAVTGGGIDAYGTGSSNPRQGPAASNLSSSTCRISCGFDNGAFTDWDYVAVAFFR